MIYGSIFRMRFLNRAGSWKKRLVECFGIVLNVVLLYYLYLAVYDGRDSFGKIPFSTMVTYVVVSQIMNAISELNGTKIASHVSGGKISYELLKPYSIPVKAVVEAGADFCVGLLFKMIPLVILAACTIGMEAPDSFMNGFLGVISILLGVGIWWGIRMVIQMFGFWYSDMLNIFMMVGTFYYVFLGGIIPYWFLSESLVKVLMCTPCGYVLHLPMEIYFGHVTMWEALGGMTVQCIWIVLLAFLTKKLFVMGKRKVQTAN